MKAVKNIMTAIASVAVMAMLVLPAYAAGDETETKTTEKEVCVTQYGGGTECSTETITEEVVHKREDQEVVHGTVDAGIEDINFISIAGIMSVATASFLILSKISQKVYLLD